MEGDALPSSGKKTQADTQMVQAFQTNYDQVQSILDQNKLLIDEINQNHESKMPNNLTRNVGLIRELNNNIRRVVDMYSDLSIDFTKVIDASPDMGSNAKHGNKRVRPV